MKNLFTPFRQQRQRLRWLLGLLFLGLMVPGVLLVEQAYKRLKWEGWYQQQQLATALVDRIDAALATVISTEESRRFGDYQFEILRGDSASNYLERSPLSQLPIQSPIAGIIGYFEVQPDGSFRTPLLPVMTGSDPESMAPEDRQRRQILATRMQQILQRSNTLDGQRDLELVERSLDQRSRLDDVTPASPTSVVAIADSPARGVRKKEDEADAAELQSSLGTDGLLGSVSKGHLPASRQETREAKPTFAYKDEKANYQRVFDQLKKSPEAKAPASGDEVLAEEILKEKFEDAARVNQNKAVSEPSLSTPQPPSSGKAKPPRSKRREQNLEVGGFSQPSEDRDEPALPSGIRIFESELDGFDIALIDPDHFVMYRNAWRVLNSGQSPSRFVQGALIERQPFVEQAMGRLFRESSLLSHSDLSVRYRGDIIQTLNRNNAEYQSRLVSGDFLHRARLSAPFADLELVFTLRDAGNLTGAQTLAWIAGGFALVLCLGFWFLYRLGYRLIGLNEQQQDFVSAVSHELKTPLTSIRMYSEMLRAGWVDEVRRSEYYQYIFSESERLSRLIENVLQLARMRRNSLTLSPEHVSIAELMERLIPLINGHLESTGFTLDWQLPEDVEAGEASPADEGARPVYKNIWVNVDEDALTQVVINLVDNAIKFSAGCEPARVQIRMEIREQEVTLRVRDFGPGIPAKQRKRIFELFYRSESEMTRTTAGTGIGLALVNELVRGMGGRVDVRNADPGAEFLVILPFAD